ncbi:MAG: FHA domain-containing protein [Micrococcales bacterium]|nr:FHA domain-containing protein [Micrococcales bacterium]
MTTVSSYVPGDWTAVVCEGFVALLGPATAPATAERLWFGSQDQLSFIDGLSVLAADGFGAMQPFVLSVRGDDGVTHVAVRGDVIVDAQVQDTVVTIDGHGVATWTERNLGGVSALVVRVPGGSEGPDLPLVAGVVRAGGLRAPHGAKIGSADESADSEEPAPAGSLPASVKTVAAAREGARKKTTRPKAQPPAPEPVAETGVTAAAAEEYVEPTPADDNFAGGDVLPDYSAQDDAAPSDAPTAQLVLNTGLIVALDRPVLLGRAPQAARVSSREMPRLVAVPSPQQDISRTHAEVRMDGDDVLVTDLDSTNGVHVLRPGGGARRLRPGEPRVLAADETIDLGDGVTFVVERMR